MQNNFILANDTDTANRLRLLGFEEICNVGDKWFFLNCEKINFSLELNAVYTDKIFL